MYRTVRIVAITVLIAFAMALYREWVQRKSPAPFIPLGFFESAQPVITPEKKVSLPATWDDPIKPVVMNDSEFDDASSADQSEEQSVDILVVGGTLGGTAAMLSAASDGATTMLVTDGEWRKDILTYAGFFLEEELPSVDTSTLETDIRTHIARMRGIARTERGLPSDIAQFLQQKIDALPAGSVLSEYTIVALARNESGKLHRALLRSNDGIHSIRIEFKTIIDGTKEGSLMALAGVASHTSWDSGTGEPDALPPAALDALARGYTMSGRTINGIGRRLDGVRAQMGIIDRGYHGTFIAPDTVDDCWEKDVNTRPTVTRQTVLRTKTIGCSARFFFESSFQDTVEVFFVNHGNERVSATVQFGSGSSFDVETLANPSDPFIRIGAFPISHITPLRIDIHSSLPTDNLEGLIIRKLNTGMESTSLAMNGNQESVYVAGPWTYTNNDVYVRAAGLETPPTLLIDDAPFPTQYVGKDTYRAVQVPMHNGERRIRIAEHVVNDALLTMIPVSPANKPLTITPLVTKGKRSWEITPPRDGTVVITLPRKACSSACTFAMTDTNATIMFSGSIDTLTGRPATHALLGKSTVTGGQRYTITLESQEQYTATPTVSYIEDAAGIYEHGTTTTVLNTPMNGFMYDVWIHTPRSEHATVTLHGTTIETQALNGWTYAGTSIASMDDISVKAGGLVEMYAIPNTSLDVYNITLPPKQSLSIGQEDLPSGTYDISAYSETNPWTVSVTNGQTNTIQQVGFDQEAGYFVSQQSLMWHHDDSLLISSSEWPLSVTIHQSVAELSAPVARETKGKPQFTVLAKPTSITDDNILLNASGSILFTPMPEGIAPVTIGLLEHPHTDTYVRSILDAAFARLRYADVSDACIGNADPTCDSRRYVRDPSIFNTNDSQSVHAVTVDGRRLAGIETLSQSGAFAIRTSCALKCNTLCIEGTINDDGCLQTQKNRSLTENAILAVRGTNTIPSITSSAEDSVGTLPSLFNAIRRYGLLKAKKTYLEGTEDARDFSLSLGMFIPKSEENFLVANTTVSATHIASRALRSSSTELAIGSAVGHVAAFAVLEEHSPPAALARTPEAMERLQRYLIERGTMVFPTFDIENDHLLMKSIQIRLLDKRATMVPVWAHDRLTNTTHPTMDESIDDLRSSVFGDDTIRTVQEALSALSGIPQESVLDLLNYGVSQGFITQKMLLLSLRDIMGQQLNVHMLLKAEYVLRTSNNE